MSESSYILPHFNSQGKVGGYMSNVEVEELKTDIREIKTDLKGVAKAMNDVQVLIAGQYVTKDELKDHVKADDATHEKLHGRITNVIVGVSGAIIMFLLKVLWDYIQRGG